MLARLARGATRSAVATRARRAVARDAGSAPRARRVDVAAPLQRRRFASSATRGARCGASASAEDETIASDAAAATAGTGREERRDGSAC